MISPTGKGIRVDAEGDGHYGHPRGTRIHRGVDYLCDEGQDIVSPFDMIIEKRSYPYPDREMHGISWRVERSTGRMWYFKVFPELLGVKVYKGMSIGIAQSISAYYNLPKMKDHIHFQVNK